MPCCRMSPQRRGAAEPAAAVRSGGASSALSRRRQGGPSAPHGRAAPSRPGACTGHSSTAPRSGAAASECPAATHPGRPAAMRTSAVARGRQPRQSRPARTPAQAPRPRRVPQRLPVPKAEQQRHHHRAAVLIDSRSQSPCTTRTARPHARPAPRRCAAATPATGATWTATATASAASSHAQRPDRPRPTFAVT